MTVNDFTVSATIPKKLYQTYQENAEEDKKSLKAFKEALIDQLRSILHAATDLNEQQTKIIDFQFVFYNKDMIKLLKK